MKAQPKNNRKAKQEKQHKNDAPHDVEKTEKQETSGRSKGTIMKNNTFDQIINSNLASVDPGFGQFAFAKVSADLFKKVLNK